jgi:hypothetical protein
MADTGRENKLGGRDRGRLARVVWVLRWMWVAVLLILLLTGIVCRAPWKVIGLIGVFLLACIALPYRRRKHFWAAVRRCVLSALRVQAGGGCLRALQYGRERC